MIAFLQTFRRVGQWMNFENYYYYCEVKYCLVHHYPWKCSFATITLSWFLLCRKMCLCVLTSLFGHQELIVRKNVVSEGLGRLSSQLIKTICPCDRDWCQMQANSVWITGHSGWNKLNVLNVSIQGLPWSMTSTRVQLILLQTIASALADTWLLKCLTRP